MPLMPRRLEEPGTDRYHSMSTKILTMNELKNLGKLNYVSSWGEILGKLNYISSWDQDEMEIALIERIQVFKQDKDTCSVLGY